MHVLPAIAQLPLKDHREGVSQPLCKFMERLDPVFGFIIPLIVRNVIENLERPGISNWLAFEDGAVSWPRGNE